MACDKLKELVGYDAVASADANVQHLLHFIEGYRAVLTEGITPECPYSPGSAHAASWEAGWQLGDKDIIDALDDNRIS